MKFSVIIPVHNAQDTLRLCLDAVFSSHEKDFEVIVVNDKSTDDSVEITKGYPTRIVVLEEEKGTAFARNIGKDNAQGQTFVFIDADVLIKEDTLNIIDSSFSQDKDIVAITGILSKEIPHNDFFTQYKNLYMHYIFKKCPRFIDFLYGSLIAIKKEEFLPFNESFKITDDTELGQHYKGLNKKILLNPELEVVHLKRYNFKNIIKNDFFVPFWWAKSFILYKGYKDILKKKRFSHAHLNQIMSIIISYLLIFSLLFAYLPILKIISIILLLFFLLLNYNFFLFLHREKRFLFLVKASFFIFLDSLVMGIGIILGLFYFCLKPSK